MITSTDLAAALAKCAARRTEPYFETVPDYEPPIEYVIIDGSFDLERAAKLLNRLEQLRAFRDHPFRMFMKRVEHPERTITVKASKP